MSFRVARGNGHAEKFHCSECRMPFWCGQQKINGKAVAIPGIEVDEHIRLTAY